MSIAVLPLENLMNDPEQDYFVSGMTDAIITDLSRLTDLRVISRTSAARIQKSGKSIPEIARELRVDVIVEGSVLRVGTQVRVEVQLLDGLRDEHLWAQSYVRNLEDVLVLQRSVAESIAHEIGSVLRPGQSKTQSTRPFNWQAYQLYLKGNHQVLRLSKGAFRRAIQYYNQAIESDPLYAPAYGGLAHAYIALGGWHSSVDPQLRTN